MMSRIVFLQKDIFAKPAVMALSACVKRAGHACFVVVADLEKDPVSAVLQLNPDVIAFSITTSEFPFMREMGTRLRALSDKIIICGGSHATFSPEVIREPYLNAICRGEGDEVLPEVLSALDQGASLENIPNMWVKKKGTIFKNDVRPLIVDLDSLPFYDREVYTRYPLYAVRGREILFHNVVSAGRGCPKSCTFCFNKRYNKIYEGKGPILRRRSVAHLMKELKELKLKAGVKFFTVDDDSFTMASRPWFNEFCTAYAKEIGLPFKINSTPGALTEDRVRGLKEAGCFAVKMGVESGNDAIRNIILRKNLREETILEAARLLRKYGIRYQTFNIVGSPGESLSMSLETYCLNRRIRPDFTWCSLLNPYPGTDIYDLCKKEGMISEEPSSSFFTGLPVDLPHKKEMVNLQQLMNFGIRLNLPESVIRVLVKLPLSGLYNLIFGAGITWGLIRINKGSFGSVVWLALNYLSRYNINKNKKGPAKMEPGEPEERMQVTSRDKTLLSSEKSCERYQHANNS